MNINIQRSLKNSSKMNSKRSTLRHDNQTFTRPIQRENPKSRNREATLHIQVIYNETISRFLIRNFGGQKAVG